LRQRRAFGRRFLKVRGSIYSHLRPQRFEPRLIRSRVRRRVQLLSARPAHFRQRCVASATPESGRDACFGAGYGQPVCGAIARKARSLTKLKARSLSRPGPPWMDQVQRPDSSSELLYCDHYPGRTTLYWCTAGQSARTARKVELSIRTCQINDRDTL
jgi:hypothetical protein